MDNNNLIENNDQNNQNIKVETQNTDMDIMDSSSQAPAKFHNRKTILTVICILVACVAIGLIALVVIKPQQLSNNYHTEQYEGTTYYIFDKNYTGEYSVQTGSFESDEPARSDNYWDPINEKVEAFNTQQILSYDDYASFCQKWNLAQRFSDQDKNYIAVAYASIGSAYIDVNLADVIIDSSKATLFLYDNAEGIVGSAAYYVVFVPVDKTITSFDITPLITEEEMQNIKKYDTPYDPNNITVAKPIIYLYPTENTEVSVKLGYPDKLTSAYPTYNNEWRVIAHPDGSLQDTKTGRELYSLYYEGKAVTDFDRADEGFMVRGDNSATFLEEKLELLGLNLRETEEFIIYWLPKLESAPYNFIRFATSDEIDSNMPLSVTPSPDNMIRILMVFKPLNSPIEVNEQQFSTPSRDGFTVVEWGGMELGGETTR